jgi:hypothetical protein
MVSGVAFCGVGLGLGLRSEKRTVSEGYRSCSGTVGNFVTNGKCGEIPAVWLSIEIVVVQGPESLEAGGVLTGKNSIPNGRAIEFGFIHSFFNYPESMYAYGLFCHSSHPSNCEVSRPTAILKDLNVKSPVVKPSHLK